MKRILLVDDSAMIRTSLRRMFEEGGWACGEASNGQEAIARAEEFKPDIIVLDLSMPVMNGLAAGKILNHIFPGTALILFTSFGAVLNADDLHRAGFSALIGKNDAGKLVITAQFLLNPS